MHSILLRVGNPNVEFVLAEVAEDLLEPHAADGSVSLTGDLVKQSESTKYFSGTARRVKSPIMCQIYELFTNENLT